MNKRTIVLIAKELFDICRYVDLNKCESVSDAEAAEILSDPERGILWFAEAEDPTDNVDENGKPVSSSKLCGTICQPGDINLDTTDAVPDYYVSEMEKLRTQGWEHTKFIEPIVLDPEVCPDPSDITEDPHDLTALNEAREGAVPYLLKWAWGYIWPFLKQLGLFTAIVEVYKHTIGKFINKYFDNTNITRNKFLYGLRTYYGFEDYSYEKDALIRSQKSDCAVTKDINSQHAITHLPCMAVAFPWWSFNWTPNMILVDRDTGENLTSNIIGRNQIVICSPSGNLKVVKNTIKESRFPEYFDWVHKERPLVQKIDPIEPIIAEVINPDIEPTSFTILISRTLQDPDSLKEQSSYVVVGTYEILGTTRIDLSCVFYKTSLGYEDNQLLLLQPDWPGDECFKRVIFAGVLPQNV